MTRLLQLIALIRLTSRRLFFTRSMYVIIAIAALPIGISLLISLINFINERPAPPVEQVHLYQERLLRWFYLHFLIFFAAISTGFAAVRKDLDDRTLHYLVLAPVERWAVAVAKFISFCVLITAVVLTSYWSAYLAYMFATYEPDAIVNDLFGKAFWFGVLVRESLVIVLAITTYGAIAMAGGSLFQSLVFAPFLFVWELALPWIPANVKGLSLTHYFHSLLPVKMVGEKHLLELLGEPATVTQSVLVLGTVIAVCLAVTLLVIWQRECAYIEDPA